jgi:hypothetical protein
MSNCAQLLHHVGRFTTMLILLSAAVGATDIYVATNGSDISGNGTEVTPI